MLTSVLVHLFLYELPEGGTWVPKHLAVFVYVTYTPRSAFVWKYIIETRTV